MVTLATRILLFHLLEMHNLNVPSLVLSSREYLVTNVTRQFFTVFKHLQTPNKVLLRSDSIKSIPGDPAELAGVVVHKVECLMMKHIISAF